MGEISHPEISLNSVVGLTSPNTFKLKGEVNGKEVIVMIDPGATHNFISTRAIEALGVECSGVRPFDVSLGTGETINSKGECKSVVVQIARGYYCGRFSAYPTRKF